MSIIVHARIVDIVRVSVCVYARACICVVLKYLLIIFKFTLHIYITLHI